MSVRPARGERLTIAGPAGDLELLIDTPEQPDPQHVAVMCHPHPLFGGTMDNKVVHTLARCCGDLGVTAVRFNFRGVGASAGVYDEGVGETDDAHAVIAWARSRFPGAGLWLGGFSFGGAVAIHAARQARPELLIAVSPAVKRLDRLDISTGEQRHCPWLIVQGDADEVVEARSVLDWAAGVVPPPQLLVMKGASHFFHGRLHELRTEVVAFARQQLEKQNPAAECSPGPG